MSLLLDLRSGQVFTVSVTDTMALTEVVNRGAVLFLTVNDRALGVTPLSGVGIDANGPYIDSASSLSASYDGGLGLVYIDTAGGLFGVSTSPLGGFYVDTTGGAAGFAVPSDVLTTASIFNAIITDDTGLRDYFVLGTVVDLLGLTDSISFAVNKLGLSDLAALTDSVVNNPQPAYTDASGMTDTISFAIGRGLPVNDSAGMTDSISFAQGYVLNLSDSMGVQDSTAFGYGKSVSDDVGSNDNTSTARTVSVTDNAGLTDSVQTIFTPATNWTVNITDSAGSSDTSLASGGHVLSVTDAMGLTDSVFTAGKIITLTVVDGTMSSPSDTMSTVTQYHVSVTDDAGLDGTYTSRNQHQGTGTKVLQMVEYITRMQE